ncbi:cobalt ECF transporter T component CbiQ [Desulfobacterales bacterium HSG16]|nr:cobalt ECF transporter T component CbiQ [Desulfobacterales bacterium HSG16]
MIKEPFAIGNSWIHRLDPRYKICFAVLFSVTVAVFEQFPSLVTALVISVCLACLARLSIKETAKRLAVVAGFLALVWIMLPLTYEGEPIFSIGSINFTRPGIIFAAQISLKSIAILLVFITLVATMSVATLGYALSALKIPDKLVFLLLMTYRYIFVIENEYRKLHRSAKIRGFSSKTNIHSYRTWAYMVGMIFVRASARADRVYQAMRCRGFSGRFFCLHEFPSHTRNIIFSVIMLIFTTCLVVLEIKTGL